MSIVHDTGQFSVFYDIQFHKYSSSQGLRQNLHFAAALLSCFENICCFYILLKRTARLSRWLFPLVFRDSTKEDKHKFVGASRVRPQWRQISPHNRMSPFFSAYIVKKCYKKQEPVIRQLMNNPFFGAVLSDETNSRSKFPAWNFAAFCCLNGSFQIQKAQLDKKRGTAIC